MSKGIGFKPVIGATVGKALADLIANKGMVIVGQSWANTNETVRVLGDLGAIIDHHFDAGGDAITLTFVERHPGTNPVLSLDTLDDGPLLEELTRLLTNRYLILDVREANISSPTGVYDVGVRHTILYVGLTCVWRLDS